MRLLAFTVGGIVLALLMALGVRKFIELTTTVTPDEEDV